MKGYALNASTNFTNIHHHSTMTVELDDAKILNNLVKKYTDLEIDLEAIIAVRENPMLLAEPSSS